MAELLFGAEKSVRREQNRARIQRLTETFPMLPVGLAVVRRYGWLMVKSVARCIGRLA